MSPLVDEFNGSSRSRCVVGARVKIAISRGGCYRPSASTKQKRYPYSTLTPYTRGCATRYVYVKLAAGVAYYGFVPENIITTVEQTSGYITTTYAPIGLRSTKESTCT